MISDTHFHRHHGDPGIAICWREGERHREISKFGVEAASILDRLDQCPDSETMNLILLPIIEEWKREHD